MLGTTALLHAMSDDTLTVSSDYCTVDTTYRLILINKNTATIQPDTATAISTLKAATCYRFSSPATTFEIGKKYEVFDADDTSFSLYFTQLPVIRITTHNAIVRDSMICARFLMVEQNNTRIFSNIGIRYRGVYSYSVPKKSFSIEFWDDTRGAEPHNYRLCTMRKDDDWVLLAQYNEPLRLRNRTNPTLWRQIDTLYYQEKNPSVTNGIRAEYTELFLNGKYLGVYALGERIDRKQLDLEKPDDGTINGELYKGITWGTSTFTEFFKFNNDSSVWGGFEYKYPDDTIEWVRISGFVDFIMNEDSARFYEEYENRLSIDNAVNYFIFLNLLRATDNTGKNVYIARRTRKEPYFFVPWDLDGSFGTIYDGTSQNITNDILTNGLYTRLLKDSSPDGFIDRLKNRWSFLRQSTITHSNIMARFRENHDYLKANGVYAREAARWEKYTYSNDHLDYMSKWLEKRLDFLDSTFSALTVAVDTHRPVKPHAAERARHLPVNTSEGTICNSGLTPAAVTIVSPSGRTVFNGIVDHNTTIRLPRTTPGVYFIKMEHPDMTSTHMFIRMK